jgi:hypothetical protein
MASLRSDRSRYEARLVGRCILLALLIDPARSVDSEDGPPKVQTAAAASLQRSLGLVHK